MRKNSQVEEQVDPGGVSESTTLTRRVAQSAVKSAIQAALQRRWDADADDIHIDVTGSNVTLSGNVRNWWDREVAQQSAWAAPGVRTVVDRMTIDY
jgi:osmotically-inducible protein OsmY